MTGGGIDRPLARLLSVGAPHRAERAMLGTPAHRLHRGPGILLAWHEVPPRRPELGRVHLTRLVDPFRLAVGTTLDGDAPGDVAVALHHGVRAALIVRLFRIQGGVDAAVDHPGAARAGALPELVADQGVAGVDPDADDVTLLELSVVERLKRLVGQDGVAPLGGCGRSEHVEPARGDDGGTERKVARVDDVYVHETSSNLNAQVLVAGIPIRVGILARPGRQTQPPDVTTAYQESSRRGQRVAGPLRSRS